MKNLKFILLLLFVIPLTQTHAEEEENICETKKGFEIYECRVKAICDDEETGYKVEKITYNPEDEYEEPEGFESFKEAKEIYRKNMGYIYKCNLIQTQKNTLKLMKKLIKDEKTGELDSRIGEKIKNREKELDRMAGQIPCSLTEKDSIQNKFNLLKETTYEMCRYINYLEYLKLYAKDLGNAKEGEDEEKYEVTYLGKRIVNFLYEIEDEKEHTYKVYPIAYYAYSDYENNFPVHFLLEIIKEDFIILRKNLYATLMPIAQVGYKAVNAMSY